MSTCQRLCRADRSQPRRKQIPYRTLFCNTAFDKWLSSIFFFSTLYGVDIIFALLLLHNVVTHVSRWSACLCRKEAWLLSFAISQMQYLDSILWFSEYLQIWFRYLQMYLQRAPDVPLIASRASCLSRGDKGNLPDHTSCLSARRRDNQRWAQCCQCPRM